MTGRSAYTRIGQRGPRGGQDRGDDLAAAGDRAGVDGVAEQLVAVDRLVVLLLDGRGDGRLDVLPRGEPGQVEGRLGGLGHRGQEVEQVRAQGGVGHAGKDLGDGGGGRRGRDPGGALVDDGAPQVPHRRAAGRLVVAGEGGQVTGRVLGPAVRVQQHPVVRHAGNGTAGASHPVPEPTFQLRSSI
ncbi:hypothetical protein ACQP2P_30225 [Dactylosporangium sp. CA-139114]|uniref:hypothetical protein n=1 Tax=Dactylosporangium sp. CA-139114 TaxID=3239931 RepID=UPI003D98A42E